MKQTTIFLATFLFMSAYSFCQNSYDSQNVKDSSVFTKRENKLKGVTISFTKKPERKSEYVAKIPLKNIENPQVYNVISHKVLENQVATSYEDAFKNIPGTEVPAAANNGRIDISSRGFKVRSYIFDGISGYTMSSIDIVNIDRIEVLRGPSATLFGGSLISYGGLINIVTKKPYAYFGGRLSYYLGSFGLNRLTLDINTPVNKKKNLLFRINAAAETANSYQDAGFHKNITVAPSLVYNINKNLVINADFKYYQRKATSPFWFTPWKKTKILDRRNLKINDLHSFSNNDVFYTNSQLTGRIRANLKIGKTWTSQTIIAGTRSLVDGNRLNLVGISDSTLYHKITADPSIYATMEIQQNFLNILNFGKFSNKLVAGLDFYKYYNDAESKTISVDTTFFLNDRSDYNTFSLSQINQAIQNKNFKYKHTRSTQNTYSAYVSDVISYNKRWFLMLGLRLDYFQNVGKNDLVKQNKSGDYNQLALSPKIGLVYQVMPDKIALFGNYMNGFENVGGADYQGNIFKPQQANQLEAGIKLSFLGGKLFSTISAYQIKVNNMLRSDLDHPEFSIQDGTELSKGVEVSLNYNPIPEFNIVAGYAFNYCVYVKAKQGMEGLRPDGAGPQNTANLWVNYQIRNGIFKGLGFGVGGQYGSHVSTIKSFALPYFIPEYKVFDAAIYYQFSFFKISFKVNNLSNENYYTNRLTWQAPRNLVIGATFDFGVMRKLFQNNL